MLDLATLSKRHCARSTCNIRALLQHLLIAIRIDKPHQNCRHRAFIEEIADDVLNFRRELRKIVNAEAFLDSRHFIHDLFKSVFAE